MNHNRTEAAIDILFRSLQDAGYGLESERKTRSAMHDETHAIYATRANHFVTRDRKLLSKVRAVYGYLEAECTPMSVEQLIEHSGRVFAERLSRLS